MLRERQAPFLNLHPFYDQPVFVLFLSTNLALFRHMTENRPRRSRTTNPADKRNCTGHLLLRPPTQNHPQSAQRNATPPDAARRPASHFGRRPHIIGCLRIPVGHPSAGTLVPTSNQGHPFEQPLRVSPENQGTQMGLGQNAILGSNLQQMPHHTHVWKPMFAGRRLCLML